jgi:hypothetical protein
MTKKDRAAPVRTASCACGAVRATTSGAPKVVNACSCFDCQKRTGSAFSYTAFFPNDAIEIAGETRSYRETRAAGRWQETSFCVVCGVPVISRLEAFPQLTGVAAGCFSDPTFDPPHAFYWTSRRPHWVPLPMGIKSVERQ